MRDWEKGTRFWGVELGDSDAHGFGGHITNLYMIHIEREREKEKDRPLHKLLWPSKLLAARMRSARKKPQ